MEETFIVIKPDAVRRNLVGKILSRFEESGFSILKVDFLTMTKNQAQDLYSIHRGSGFYENLIEFMTQGPSLVVLMGREGAVMRARYMIGAISPSHGTSLPGSIRGDYATSISENVIHASDSISRANHESSIFFGE